MAEANPTRAIDELKKVVREPDLDTRMEAFAAWGVRWLLQLQGEVDSEQELRALPGAQRASIRREVIDRMAKVIARDWLDDAVEVQLIDERKERLVLSLLKGRPFLGDAPDAIVIPLRPKP